MADTDHTSSTESDEFALGSVQVALTPLERFEEFLQSRGMRVTQERRFIVEEVFRSHDHFDAEELLGRLQGNTEGVKVSRPTVYRALSALVEAGLLRKMALNGRAVYEHDYGYPQHDHLHCQKCDKLIEFHSEELNEIRDAVGRQNNFRVLGHRLTITGICQECSRPKRENRRLDRI